MKSSVEKKFDKYEKRGNQNWEQMMSKDFRFFNAYQQARYGWIVRFAGDLRGKKILDLGCGGGSLTYILAKAGAEVTGVEQEGLGLQFAKENLMTVDRDKNWKYSFVQASAYELPFEKDYFDTVVNCEVIEHLENPEKMLQEVARVLKKGGKFILTTPYRLTEVPQDPNHVKEYFPGELEAMLKKYFSNVGIKLTHHMFWRAFYTYPVRLYKRRPLGKWFVNILVLLFGWNPFMIDHATPGKFDVFSTICAWGSN